MVLFTGKRKWYEAKLANFSTVMFALGRVPGWIAHWREMRMNNDPIGRPRQVYVGSNHRTFKT